MAVKLNLTLIAAAVLLTGCAVSKPNTADALAYDSATRWSTESLASAESAELDKINHQWWGQFEDPTLGTLVSKALAGSPSLAQANARIDQARASARVSGLSGVPSADASAWESREDGSRSQGFGLDASWELDLTGKLSMMSKAAWHRYIASDAAYKHARTRLSAEVGRLFFEYRHCQQTVGLQRESLDSRLKTLDLVKFKVQHGAEARTTQFQIEAGVAEAQNAVESQKGSCQRLRQQLVAVTAMPSAEVRSILREGDTAGVPAILPLPYVTIPANVIRQRPDINQLEHLVLASAEEVGIAAAQRLPSIRLSGNLGWDSLGGSSSWSWGPQVTLPIFDGGRLKFGQTRALAAYNELVAAWKEGVLSATNEVEDSLIRLNVVHKQVTTADFALARYEAVFKASEVRFQHGAASLLELEDSRRSALAAKQARQSLSHEYTQARISLYKAAGGAWTTVSTDPASKS